MRASIDQRWWWKEITRRPRWPDGILGLAILAMGVQAYLLFYSPQPIAYPVQPISVESRRLRVSDPFVYTVTRCAEMDQAVVTTASLVRLSDGLYIVMPGGAHLLTAGCETKRLVIERFLPPGLEPGWYRVEGVSQAHGRWRSVAAHWVTEPFEVVR